MIKCIKAGKKNGITPWEEVDEDERREKEVTSGEKGDGN